MSHQSELIASDIQAYLKSQEEKGLLRFITCGSVDDGKSTLIGRMLWDSKLIFEDQLAALEADSKRVGTQGEAIDYALLLDGLQAEREQGITIDVAYRYFSTDRRKFIVADTPGHEQYTRNMVTGASTAQVAVILIDARKGILTQTRRHSYLVSLVGIRHVVLAINKMDLVGYDGERFAGIVRDYEVFAAGLGFDQVAAIPISALKGDNVLTRSDRTPWYQGPPLLEFLEQVEVADTALRKPFRMRVQWVNRPHLDFRGYCGTVASGVVRPGDELVVAASGQTSKIARIVTLDGDLDEAVAGQAVTLTLADELDISRGDTLAAASDRPYQEDGFEAKLVWLHEEPLVPGRSYLLKAGAATTPARVRQLRFKVNVNSLQQEAGEALALNEVGICNITLDRLIAFDSYRENRGTGNFILIDRQTNATVGAGMIHQPLLAGVGEHWSALALDRAALARQKDQVPGVLWFSAAEAAKAEQLASLVAKRLYARGRHVFLLGSHAVGRSQKQGDRTSPDRLGADARLLVEAGLIVLAPLPAAPAGGRQAILSSLAPADCREVCIGALPEATEGPWGQFPVAEEITAELAEQVVRQLFP
ncbi:sulfate adenylyltransferase subunit CysN [Desulfuromonas carbonis]